MNAPTLGRTRGSGAARLHAPEVVTARVMADTISSFFCLGGLAGLLMTAGSAPGEHDRALMVGLSVTALVCAIVVHRWGARWPRRTFHGLVVSGALLIDLGVLLGSDAGTAVATAALMSFIVFDAYLFFRRRAATWHLCVALSTVTGALLARGDVAFTTALALDVVMIGLGTASRYLVDQAASASRDALTGLLNRRGFDTALHELLTESARTGRPLSAALLDLDGFKGINDTHGHDAGDSVLRLVADTYRAALPPNAVLARHGGDEFALLLPGATGPAALTLLRQLSAAHPDQRLSCGVAQHHVGDDPARLMRRADQALYAAKTAGRGRCELSPSYLDPSYRDSPDGAVQDPVTG